MTEDNTYNIPLFQITDKSLLEQWKSPEKRIFSSIDIPSFKKSKAIENINGIITLICSNISLKNVPKGALDDKLVYFEKNSFEKPTEISGRKKPPVFDSDNDGDDKDIKEEYSPITVSILNILNEFQMLKDDTPPFEGPRRYGNLACRNWHDKITDKIDYILNNELKCYFYNDNTDDMDTNVIKENFEGFKKEIKYYLLGSFGSRERLDYGTGHELSFIAFLGCFIMINLINRHEFNGNEWLIILSKYYDFVKSLILTYTLEPAGSHGVWGLDDHFHLIYVFGACQLIDFNKLGNDEKIIDPRDNYSVLNFRMNLSPSSILNTETLREQRTKNLYYNAISFIRMVKKGPFKEHSPILFDVASTKNWEKVVKGMLKMYYGEVLSKFPVVQHFYFGGVFYPWIDCQNNSILPSSEGENLKDDNMMLKKSNSGSYSNRYQNEVNSTMSGSFSKRETDLNKLIGNRSNRAGNNDRFTEVTTKAPWSR